METLWTIVAVGFTLGVFVPLIVASIVLPLVLLAMLWRVVYRP